MAVGLNKITAALIAVFVFIFLLLLALAHILCALTRRRRNQSRIEPKETASKTHEDSDAAAVDDRLEKWRELCGPSRALFTINEEEERDGIEFNFEFDLQDGHTTAFHTPFGSPPYFTPSPSPIRDAGLEKDFSDFYRTTTFFAIEISSSATGAG